MKAPEQVWDLGHSQGLGRVRLISINGEGLRMISRAHDRRTFEDVKTRLCNGRESTDTMQKRCMRMAWRGSCWLMWMEEGGGTEEYICRTELLLCNVPDSIISRICQHGKLQHAIKFRWFPRRSKRSPYYVTLEASNAGTNIPIQLKEVVTEHGVEKLIYIENKQHRSCEATWRI